MVQVGIVMGSDSDMAVMSKAADVLEELGISYEMRNWGSPMRCVSSQPTGSRISFLNGQRARKTED